MCSVSLVDTLCIYFTYYFCFCQSIFMIFFLRLLVFTVFGILFFLFLPGFIDLTIFLFYYKIEHLWKNIFLLIIMIFCFLIGFIFFILHYFKNFLFLDKVLLFIFPLSFISLVIICTYFLNIPFLLYFYYIVFIFSFCSLGYL